MTDGVLIREARPEEYTFVGNLVVGAYRTLDDAGDATYEGMLRDVASRVATSRVLVAEVDGAVLGRVTYVRPGGDLAEVDDPHAAGASPGLMGDPR